jgi:hypothetical protein
MSNKISIKGVSFKKVNEKFIKKADLSNLLFVMMSQSGAYDSFIRELNAKNLPYFWFQTAIDVYKDKYC